LKSDQFLELVLFHESEQLVFHFADDRVAKFHHSRAHLHGIAPEQNKLGRVFARLDTADAAERLPGNSF